MWLISSFFLALFAGLALSGLSIEPKPLPVLSGAGLLTLLWELYERRIDAQRRAPGVLLCRALKEQIPESRLGWRRGLPYLINDRFALYFEGAGPSALRLALSLHLEGGCSFWLSHHGEAQRWFERLQKKLNHLPVELDCAFQILSLDPKSCVERLSPERLREIEILLPQGGVLDCQPDSLGWDVALQDQDAADVLESVRRLERLKQGLSRAPSGLEERGEDGERSDSRRP